MLSFKLAFSLSSFTLIERLFGSSSFSAITVVSSAYLRLLIFLPRVDPCHCIIHSFTYIYSITQKIFHTYLGPGILVSTGDSTVKIAENNPCPPRVNILGGQVDNKQNKWVN